MKSKITIEVDFDNGNMPVIQILQSNSDDVRDKLISVFLQSLQHCSRWCSITYIGHRPSYNKSVDELDHIHHWQITPITPAEFEKEMALMNSILLANKKQSELL